jgi:hypothetical protein
VKRRRRPGIERLEEGGLLTSFALPFSEVATAQTPSFFIAAGPDGNLWFVEGYAPSVRNGAPSSGNVTALVQ